MPEKKPTKKIIKEEKPVVAKEAVVAKEEIVEVKRPVVVLTPDEIADDEALSKELAQSIKDSASKPDRYFEAIGRRKTAVARIRLYTKGDKEFIVNDSDYTKYFQIPEDAEIAVSSMRKMKCLDKFRVTVVVKGGGHHAQAEAVRHGTARVLVDFNNNFRKRLRKAGFLTRDPRMRERKKFGLKRARKGPQWAKR